MNKICKVSIYCRDFCVRFYFFIFNKKNDNTCIIQSVAAITP